MGYIYNNIGFLVRPDVGLVSYNNMDVSAETEAGCMIGISVGQKWSMFSQMAGMC